MSQARSQYDRDNTIKLIIWGVFLKSFLQMRVKKSSSLFYPQVWMKGTKEQLLNPETKTTIRTGLLTETLSWDNIQEGECTLFTTLLFNLFNLGDTLEKYVANINQDAFNGKCVQTQLDAEHRCQGMTYSTLVKWNWSESILGMPAVIFSAG